MTISTQRHAQMSTSYPKSNIFMAAKDSPVAPWKRALNYFVVVVAVVGLVIRGMVKDKRAGKSSCGGDCSHCGSVCHAPKKTQK